MSQGHLSKMVGKRFSLAILISVIVHFVLLIVLGLWTVYRYVQEGDPGMEVAMEKAEEAVESPQEVMEEVEVTEVQPEVEIDLERLTVDPLHDVSLPEIVADTQAVPTPPTPTVPTTVQDRVAFTQAAPRGSWGSVFGASDESDFLLSGAFYHLQQDTNGNPTGVSRSQGERIIQNEFVEAGFDREAFDRKFYRAPEDRSVSFIAHPRMDFRLAPKAYGVEDDVEPVDGGLYWMIHYEGTISPPRTGEFRFTADADDHILVAIDGKVVVDGGIKTISDRRYHGNSVHGRMPTVRRSMTSDWIAMDENENYRIDIIVGENQPQTYYAWLFVEEKGVEYEKEDGWPKLPLFSTIEMDGPPDWEEMLKDLDLPEIRVPPMADEVLAFPRN
ncbi:MAG: hypothetical protein JJT75_11735 [Opitutales bacterium]|nr:hypothetical protein [Opitutales bacterium]MCH8540940.1 hypothetical protein [Opitutales bacterium]